jgi:hypothetical protein
MSAVLLAPAAVLLSATLADANPTVLALATAIGLLAALVQFLGLVRWPFAVPHLARLAGDPATTPATRDAIEVTFQTLNRYLGVAVGEHLGYLLTGLWTALAGVALIQSDLLHPLFGIVGLVLAPLFVFGSLEFVGPFEPRGWKLAGTVVPLATSAGRCDCWPSASACCSPPDLSAAPTPQLVIQRSWDAGASSEGSHHARTTSGRTHVRGKVRCGEVRTLRVG